MEKKDELTPEEYRKKAQKEIQNYKHQWKIFIRTGIVILCSSDCNYYRLHRLVYQQQ